MGPADGDATKAVPELPDQALADWAVQAGSPDTQSRTGKRRLITGTVVKRVGKGRQMQDEAAWWRAWGDEDPPAHPADCSVKDGQLYMWQREGDSEKLYIGPWCLTVRPKPARIRLTRDELDDVLESCRQAEARRAEWCKWH